MMNNILLEKLIDIGCLKFGDFKLKSGKTSNIYFDLRTVISHPEILTQLTYCIKNKMNAEHDLICGVPYGAIPLATSLSIETGKPMIMLRKENKEHGTKKIIDGAYQEDNSVILIEDVITTGKSILESIDALSKEKLKVKQVITVLDREDDGTQKIKDMGIDICSLFTLSELMNSTLLNKSIKKLPTYHKNPIAQKLLNIAHTKKSNIIISIDLTKTNEILNFLEKVGDSICAAKLHCDIISDFNFGFIEALKTLSLNKNFLLIEDRKFGDIGNTQTLQVTKGIYKISNWVDIITTHLISGEASLNAISQINENNKFAIIPVIEMSSKNSLTTTSYIEKCKEIMNVNNDIIGAVCQKTILNEGYLKFTPGISLSSKNDTMGQNYNTPKFAIETLKTDFLIIGRDLYESGEPTERIKIYLDEIRKIDIF